VFDIFLRRIFSLALVFSKNDFGVGIKKAQKEKLGNNK
jgi:hypothetical protein